MKWVMHFRIHNPSLKSVTVAQPHLCAQPIIIVSGSNIVEVSTVARRQGVRQDMSRAAVIQVCPEIIIVNDDSYGRESVMQEAFDLLLGYCDRLEPFGAREGFAAVTSSHIRKIIQAATVDLMAADLEVTTGVAANRLLARIASGPAGDSIRQAGAAVVEEPGQWFRELSVRYLWPLPKQSIDRLTGVGMDRIKDLQPLSVQQLTAIAGGDGYKLASYCRGEDSAEVAARYPAPEITRRLTLPGGTNDKLVLENILKLAVHDLAGELQRSGNGCRMVTVTVEWEGGQWTGKRQWEDPVCERETMEYAVRHVLAGGITRQLITGQPTAVMVRAQDLAPAEQQQESLFSRVFTGSVRRQVRGVGGNQMQVSRRERMLELFDPVRGAGSR